MSGERDLDQLLQGLSGQLDPEIYVFATVAPQDVPQGVTPVMLFYESQGVTLILTQAQADACGVAYEFPCRKITLTIHSALEAVGFIAHIATKLAEQGMGVNPVSGFYHDHLFVPVGREQEAMQVLAQIAATAASQE